MRVFLAIRLLFEVFVVFSINSCFMAFLKSRGGGGSAHWIFGGLLVCMSVVCHDRRHAACFIYIRLFFAFVFCAIIIGAAVAIFIAVAVAIATSASSRAVEHHRHVFKAAFVIHSLQLRQHIALKQPGTYHKNRAVGELRDNLRVGNDVDWRAVDQHVVILAAQPLHKLGKA